MRDDEGDDERPDWEREERVEEDAEGDSSIQTEADVTCPSCGETMSITLDPDSGANQEYVEDCQVCCRPWRVRVSYDRTGAAEVWVEQAQ